MPNFQYQPDTTAYYADCVARELAAGRFVQTTFDPEDGKITGIVGAEPHTPLADYLIKNAEHRTSTRNAR